MIRRAFSRKIFEVVLFLVTGSFVAFVVQQADAEDFMEPGLEAFYNLDYDTALEHFQRMTEESPDSPVGYNYLALGYLYKHLFRTGALETQLVSGNNPFLRRVQEEPPREEVEAFLNAINKAISICQAKLRQNPQDTFALYQLGVARSTLATYDFLIRKKWLASLRGATEARKLHNRVTELDPTNIDARLLQGVHDYVVGSLPWHWKVLGFLAGFRGDKEEGIRTIELVAARGTRNRYDAQILLAAIYRREKHPEKAIPLLKELIKRFPRNFLVELELAHMYSDLGRRADALRVLAEVERKKRSGVPGYERLSWAKLAFVRGNLLFWFQEFDEALNQLKEATAQADNLDLNSAVLAWMRVGQILDLKGRRSEAVHAYEQAIGLAPNSEAAAECRRYLRSPFRLQDLNA